MNDVIEYKLSDFYQAVVLKTVGFNLLRLENGSGRFAVFVFEDTEGKAQEVIDKFWKREVVVPVRDVVETINELKTRIYSHGYGR